MIFKPMFTEKYIVRYTAEIFIFNVVSETQILEKQA